MRREEWIKRKKKKNGEKHKKINISAKSAN